MIKNTRKSKTSPALKLAGKPEAFKPVSATAPKPAATEPATPAKAAFSVAASTRTSQSEPSASTIALELVQPEAQKVFVAGSFNEWKPERAPLAPAGNGRWVGNLSVKPGRYEYLFVVDGQWLPDPNAKETVANPFGGRNSVLTVAT